MHGKPRFDCVKKNDIKTLLDEMNVDNDWIGQMDMTIRINTHQETSTMTDEDWVRTYKLVQWALKVNK